ncbi:hypothetical protein HII36_34385 [Nonomuraea sp. NN258]|uniref:hypothetical protein n=1 Tax=Nonomuraea antri TaxID=2730852 RepID=UPI001569D38E|nr:hypothetical protein [Nonomuraea antri]NRQ36890.1 hypothetical protein [Nonomuraea antri]
MLAGDWENVPGFDDFSDQMISPYTWPQVSGYPLQSVTLAGSLQIGMQVSQS